MNKINFTHKLPEIMNSKYFTSLRAIAIRVPKSRIVDLGSPVINANQSDNFGSGAWIYFRAVNEGKCSATCGGVGKFLSQKGTFGSCFLSANGFKTGNLWKNNLLVFTLILN